MLIKRKRGWEIPESRATPEKTYFNRRTFLLGGAVVAAGAATGVMLLNRGTAGEQSASAARPRALSRGRGKFASMAWSRRNSPSASTT